MIYLIIPDIHMDLENLNLIFKVSPKFDACIFLGDWFDNYDAYNHKETAEYLLNNSQSNPNNIHILGNHDAPYFYDSGSLACSGHRWQAKEEIQRILKDHITKVKFYHKIGNWVFSHAGFHRDLINNEWNDELMEQTQKEALERLQRGVMHSWAAAGRERGGYQPIGGPTWLDFRSFKPVDGIHQMVGHTKSNSVRNMEGNFCIDTQLKTFAVIDDSEEDPTPQIYATHSAGLPIISKEQIRSQS